MKKVFLSLMLLMLFCFLAPKVEANSASLYLSPNSGTFNVQSTFDISIFVNTGENNVNAIKADLKFDPKMIQVASPTIGHSLISIWAVPPSFSNTKGYISFQGGVPTPGINSSSGLISTVKFRATNPGKTVLHLMETSQVLLDDGKGTNILNSYGKGIYVIEILPPEGPTVFSTTHSDLNKWHKDNNPSFSWEKKEGISEFSYIIDKDPLTVPDNQAEGDETSVSYSDLEDGIWYFHIKARKGKIWGGTSHLSIRIDKNSPASFKIQVSPAQKTSSKSPVISFFTTDAFSGIDHFEIKTVNISIKNQNEDTFFIDTTSPYLLSNLEVGTYLIIVRAYDKAGNWQDESIKIEIIPEETTITGKGVWHNERFFFWWPFLLIILFIIAIILIVVYKREKKYKIKMSEKLDKKRKEMNNKTKLTK